MRTFLQRPVGIFTRHYLEMVIAMLVGMIVLGPLWHLLAPGLATQGTAHVLLMAANMTIGMAAWMLIRRHRWLPIVEMSVAMVAPFVLLLVPYWAGAISLGVVSAAGHVLMLITMLLAMLLRRDEYTRPHHLIDR